MRVAATAGAAEAATKGAEHGREAKVVVRRSILSDIA